MHLQLSVVCALMSVVCSLFFFFQAEDGIRDLIVTGVQTCALPISLGGDPFETAAEHSDTVAQKRAVSRIVNVAFHDTGVSAKFTSARYALLTRQARSEEHTSELQSRSDLVCRLLLEKKKKANTRLLTQQAHTTLINKRTRQKSMRAANR